MQIVRSLFVGALTLGVFVACSDETSDRANEESGEGSSGSSGVGSSTSSSGGGSSSGAGGSSSSGSSSGGTFTGDGAVLGGGRGRLALGERHTCALDGAGGISCWGANDDGQLGDGTNTARSRPVPVSLPGRAVRVVATAYTTCALLEDATVACWGDGGRGQLGDGQSRSSNLPVLVPGLQALDVDGGGYGHLCAVSSAGAVLCWGSNLEQETGTGAGLTALVPAQATGLSAGWTQVSAGHEGTCVRSEAGAARCWGKNFFGQLGDDTYTSRGTPVELVGLSAGVRSIETGITQNCAIMESGALQCWGNNPSDTLGTAPDGNDRIASPVLGLDRVSRVTQGSGQLCALRDGAVWCWGENEVGVVGNGTRDQVPTPSELTALGTMNIDVCAGYEHTCAMNETGAVHCWGANESGQLGDGTDQHRLAPVLVVAP